MIDTERVVRALDRLEGIQADLAGITSRTDAGRRGDLIALRRALSKHITLIGQIVEPLFADPALRAKFRRHYSTMRSMAALHQAEWPAIRLGEDDAQYLRSALGVRQTNRAFVEWVRAALPSMERR